MSAIVFYHTQQKVIDKTWATVSSTSKVKTKPFFFEGACGRGVKIKNSQKKIDVMVRAQPFVHTLLKVVYCCTIFPFLAHYVALHTAYVCMYFVSISNLDIVVQYVHTSTSTYTTML